MSVCRQGFTLTQNMSWGFLLCSAYPTQGAVSQSHNVKVSSQGVMSGKKANNHPGLRPVKGQQPGLSSNTRARNQLSSLSLSASKTLPQCHVLFVQSALNFLLYILPQDPQGRLRSNKIVNGTFPCELFGNFISTYSRTSGDLRVPQSDKLRYNSTQLST
jgi:hypothetical protein